MEITLFPSIALSRSPAYLGPGSNEYLKKKIQYGYYVEEFIALNDRAEEWVNKRNQIEELVSSSYQVNSDAAYGVLEAYANRAQNSQAVTQTIAQDLYRTTQNAKNKTEFKYVKYTDGKTVYFKDGLPSSIFWANRCKQITGKTRNMNCTNKEVRNEDFISWARK